MSHFVNKNFSGALSGAGSFQSTNGDCNFTVSFSGTFTSATTHNADGTLSGTATISGTFNTTSVSGTQCFLGLTYPGSGSFSELLTVSGRPENLIISGGSFPAVNFQGVLDEASNRITGTAQISLPEFATGQASTAVSINGPPEPSLSIDDVTVDEDAGTATFTITRNGDDSSEVSVNFTTNDNTAIAGQDYTTNTGSVTLAPGESSATITVAILNDSVVDSSASETFTVDLSGAIGATISDSQGVGTIIDDDVETPALPDGWSYDTVPFLKTSSPEHITSAPWTGIINVDGGSFQVPQIITKLASAMLDTAKSITTALGIDLALGNLFSSIWSKVQLQKALISKYTDLLGMSFGGMQALLDNDYDAIDEYGRQEPKKYNQTERFFQEKAADSVSPAFIEAAGGMQAIAEVRDLRDSSSPFSGAGPENVSPLSAVIADTSSPAIALQFSLQEGRTVVAGTPNGDYIFGGNLDEQISTFGGNDVVYSVSGNDTIDLGAGADIANGGDGNDMIQGGGGNDAIDGDNGDDILLGGGGKDLLFGGAGADTLKGNSGNDKLIAGRGHDVLNGGGGADILLGGGGADILLGGTGKDRLLGGGGGDILNGGKGTDTLNGGKGNDTMTGGGGADTFLFNGNIKEGHDKILGFAEGIDVIRIKGATFSDLTITSAGANGQNTLVTLTSGTEILLKNIEVADVGISDFDFV